MEDRWELFGFQLYKVLFLIFIFQLHSEECLSLNLEGLALIEFRSKVESDPYGFLENWNPKDNDPCSWSGVYCLDGKVDMLNLNGLSLRGILAPELGKLGHLRALVLYKNNFSGVIPREIGGLTMLELLDLRSNNLSGTIPAEIGEMLSLKQLLLYDNKFQGGMPSWLGKLNMVSELQLHRNFTFNVDIELSWINRKLGHCFWQSGLQQLKKANSFMIPLKGKLQKFLNVLPLFKCKKDKDDHNVESFTEPCTVQNEEHLVNYVRRRLLQETRNLPAAPVSSATVEVFDIPSAGSGSFPASASNEIKPPPVPSDSLLRNSQTNQPTVQSVTTSMSSSSMDVQPKTSKGLEKNTYIPVILVASILVIAASMVLLLTGWRSSGGVTAGPRKTGLSGPLQKALIDGVPLLHREELEAACEEFSNIIQSYPGCTAFKGTLSSGVEIAVVSTSVSSHKEWSKRSEMHFRKKIDMLSRVSHKNFVNLIGYCEEDEPFTRMMVFEFAPSGTLCEHLHVKELEHLDWSARMRIIMGIAYCLQYMHNELNPPVVHPNLQSSSVFLTDDYAAKVGEIDFWKEVIPKGKYFGDDDTDSEMPSADPGSNVYDYGVLLLEIISGRISYSEEQGSIVDWASQYMNDSQSFSCLTDPALKSFKNNQLDIICEVIQECVYQDPKKRPTMKKVTAKLREVLGISPDSATPRLSPLWWAELELLSVEAT